jgi:ACS family hexuronate transporter-like MFS transporter
MPGRPIKHLRWYIAGMLCLASQLNYLDRQTFSVLASTIQKEFHLNDADYSIITTTFLWTYAVSYAFSGYIVDWLGARRSFLIFVSGWSVANMLHAFARSLAGLAFFRGLLALMEPANFPAGIKAISEWFPMRERALAVGVFNAGTAVGNIIAVPVAAFLTLRYGWRSAFVFTGALGLVWVAIWALAYRRPQDHARLGEEERQLILDGQPQFDTSQERISVLQLLRMPQAWGCMLARLLTDPISYFLFFWTPKYLQDARGFNLKDIFAYAWIPFLALTLGNLSSGAIPRFLTSRGWPVSQARKTTMLCVSIGMMLFCILITRATTPAEAIILLAAIMFGHAAWGNMALPAEVFHSSAVGTVTGFGGCLGGLAGGVAQLVIGSVVMKYGYNPVFMVCSVMYLAALGCVHWLIGELGVTRRVGVAKYSN